MPRDSSFARSPASTERGEISVRAASADATSSVVCAPLSGQGAGESVAPVAPTHLTGRKPLSVETPTSSASRGRGRAVRDDVGGGWLTFAGILLLIDGTLNVIGGIGAISDSKFFVNDTKYVFGNLHAWGWIILILGSVQLLTAFGLFARNTWARVVGVGFASLAAVALLLMLPAYPLWALALFTMNMLIIYGLISYTGDEYQ